MQIFIICICTKVKHEGNKLANTFKYIGKNSMEIYLLHIMFTAGLRIILLKLKINSIFIHVLLGSILGIIMPTIAFKFYKLFKEYLLEYINSKYNYMRIKKSAY